MKRLWPFLLLALGGCDLSMTRQDRHDAQGSAALWKGGPSVASVTPDGSVAQDQPSRDVALERPPTVSQALLLRGEDRYRIFCTACHGEDGEGEGLVVQRGFPRPPAFGPQDRPRWTVDVITGGSGVMYPFADRIEPADRWAIAAYVEALKRLRTNRTTGKGA